ncbi:MAG TPA: hypothetical protein VMZ66_06585 [Aeromicrobium sp.]|nr:hypothetical protein [Aeromicrobium sp.]
MTSRTPIRRVLLGLMAAAAMTPVAPSPAQAGTYVVSLMADRSSAPPTVAVSFTGGASGSTSPVGKQVHLQRQMGSSWTTIKSGTIGANKQFSFSVRVATGAYKYRAFIDQTSFSPALTVAGSYGRDISSPAAGATFTLSAQLPMSASRPVEVLWYSDGVWNKGGGAISSDSGFVAVRTDLPSTSPVRLYAPTHDALPAWDGPTDTVTIGTPK